jgi:Lytic polysaccharide mono-oxygenase, cellulose-degrading
MLLALPAAHAHAVLLDPPPRDPDQIKIAPCGGAGPTPAGAATRTVLQAGSTITVKFAETVQHPGYFRIAFSPDGLSGFDEHVLVPMIPDTNGRDYSAQVTLPSISCDNCSLQLIQCMDGSLPPIASCSNYYSCADIVLQGGTAAASPDAGTPGDPPGAGDAGSSAGGEPAPPVDDPQGPAIGGCSAAGRDPRSAAGPLLVLLLAMAGWRAVRSRVNGNPFLGDRLKAGPRALNPLMKVRILLPEPRARRQRRSFF